MASTDKVMEWLDANQRIVTIATVVVVVGAGVFWIVGKQRAQRAELASQGLEKAKESVAVGNLPLAKSDLTRLVESYGGTPAAVQGAMILAQMSYDDGKYADGIKTIQGVQSGAPAVLKSELDDLLGDGYVGLKKPSDAAHTFEDAATATDLYGAKANERLKAATAYRMAGDTAKARAIWTDLANDPRLGGINGEARVRLGELTAGGKS